MTNEAEEIARGCEAEATWLERQCFDDTAAKLRALAARVRRLAAPAAGCPVCNACPVCDGDGTITQGDVDGQCATCRGTGVRHSAPAAPVDVALLKSARAFCAQRLRYLALIDGNDEAADVALAEMQRLRDELVDAYCAALARKGGNDAG